MYLQSSEDWLKLSFQLGRKVMNDGIASLCFTRPGFEPVTMTLQTIPEFSELPIETEKSILLHNLDAMFNVRWVHERVTSCLCRAYVDIIFSSPN
jgi:hypothetical protein